MKKWILFIWLYGLILGASAQFEHKVHKHINTFSVQTGSGIGFVTAGIGNHTYVPRMEFDFMYGYIPESITLDEEWHILALKGTWNTWEVKAEQYEIRPIRLGLHVNYHFDDDFHFTNAQGDYPSNYYWWSTALRINFFVGSSVDFKFGRNRMSLYHELGTNDLYISSFFSSGNSRELDLDDILVWGFGLKWYLHPHPEPNQKP